MKGFITLSVVIASMFYQSNANYHIKKLLELNSLAQSNNQTSNNNATTKDLTKYDTYLAYEMLEGLSNSICNITLCDEEERKTQILLLQLQYNANAAIENQVNYMSQVENTKNYFAGTLYDYFVSLPEDQKESYKKQLAGFIRQGVSVLSR
ncbi:UNKNOWN [Stylonychia lemnae]|uniref:Uncharacterized protein n=1 Tax=Stylonychia lemnae TaxID=5949 RepID=A0A078ACJ2_STYLE|nr:UNKNOWN [Stylonychia lemnae]|eukprot:CDW78553.1 UNKNOWN [Stylonychia lemnae]